MWPCLDGGAWDGVPLYVEEDPLPSTGTRKGARNCLSNFTFRYHLALILTESQFSDPNGLCVYELSPGRLFPEKSSAALPGLWTVNARM